MATGKFGRALVGALSDLLPATAFASLKRSFHKARSVGKDAVAAVTRTHRSFALNELDLKLAPYMDYRNGFFIEAGANDGITQSNTVFFERYLGWRGLLVEPIPALAEKCRRNRPGCIVEQCALVSRDFSESHVVMRYANLMSLVRGSMEAEQERVHLEKGIGYDHVPTYEIQVPALPLSTILTRHNIHNIDLLSLDVEGYELDALKGLDFQLHKPKFLLVEARAGSQIDNLLGSLYYRIAMMSDLDVLYKLRAS